MDVTKKFFLKLFISTLAMLNIANAASSGAVGTTADPSRFVHPYQSPFEEKVLYSVFKLSMEDGGSGTSFLMRFNIPGITVPDPAEFDETVNIPSDFLVTNKHILQKDQTEEFNTYFDANVITYVNSGDGRPDVPECLPVRTYFEPKDIILLEGVDLCALPFEMLYEAYKGKIQERPYLVARGARRFLPRIALDDNLLADEAFLRTVHVTRDILMLGYPNGYYDDVNNYAIYRKGMIASPPAIHFKGKPEFVVDIAAIEGSSGSPIFYKYDAATHRPAFDLFPLNFTQISQDIKILGVLFSGPTLSQRVEDSDGEELGRVKSTYHLGRVIKSTQVLRLKDKIIAAMQRSAAERAARAVSAAGSSSATAASAGQTA